MWDTLKAIAEPTPENFKASSGPRSGPVITRPKFSSRRDGMDVVFRGVGANCKCNDFRGETPLKCDSGLGLSFFFVIDPGQRRV